VVVVWRSPISGSKRRAVLSHRENGGLVQSSLPTRTLTTGFRWPLQIFGYAVGFHGDHVSQILRHVGSVHLIFGRCLPPPVPFSSSSAPPPCSPSLDPKLPLSLNGPTRRDTCSIPSSKLFSAMHVNGRRSGTKELTSQSSTTQNSLQMSRSTRKQGDMRKYVSFRRQGTGIGRLETVHFVNQHTACPV
jgi:hypothetical protein